jgi:large subunit ribosomal protein L30
MTKEKESKSQIKVTQTGSYIGHSVDQRRTLLGLGLKKIGNTKILEDTASVRGMVKKVQHLISVETV